MDSQPRREDLLQAAYALLAERGFEGLRTRDVAGAVGVNVATLHYYFPTKEALIRAVVGRALARFQTTLPRNGSAAEQLRGHFSGLRALARTEPELFAVMGELALRARRDPALATILNKTDEIWHTTLEGLLRGAAADGDIERSLEAQPLAALIVASLKGVYMMPLSTGRAVRLDQALRPLERWLGLEAKKPAKRPARRR